MDDGGHLPSVHACFREAGWEKQSNDSSEVDLLLRRNNVSLLEALHEERRLRALTQDDLDAARVAREVDAEGHRLAITRFQRQVQCLCEDSGLQELFHLFETEVRRLQKELHSFHERNVCLELQCVEGDSGALPKRSSSSGGKLTRDLLLRQKIAEIDSVRKECEALRCQERGRAFSLQQSRDAARRLTLANQTSHKLKQSLEAEERDHGATKGQLMILQGEANALERECKQLKKELDTYKSELMQARVAECQAKLRKSSAVKAAAFVEKHVGRSI